MSRTSSSAFAQRSKQVSNDDNNADLERGQGEGSVAEWAQEKCVEPVKGPWTLEEDERVSVRLAAGRLTGWPGPGRAGPGQACA